MNELPQLHLLRANNRNEELKSVQGHSKGGVINQRSTPPCQMIGGMTRLYEMVEADFTFLQKTTPRQQTLGSHADAGKATGGAT